MMNAEDNIKWKHIEDLRQIIHEKSLECVRMLVPGDSVSSSKIPNPDDFVYAQCMGIVLIHGIPLKITFTIHYNYDFAKKLVATNVGITKTNLESIEDYMREYCNLTAGYITNTLAKNNINMSISLPFIISGFDEIWFSEMIHPEVYRDWWQLNMSLGSFIVGIAIEVKDDAILPININVKVNNLNDEIKFL